MRWLGWGLALKQGLVGGAKSQGSVSNNSSVSEGRTRWPLALLLQAETFLFTADFNSLWTPALAWPCSGEKWHPLQLPKNSEIFLLDRCPAVLFALTLVCLKVHILHSQRAFIVCDTFPKILSRFSVRIFFTWNTFLWDLIKLTTAMTLLMNLLKRRQMIQEVCFKKLVY